MNIEKIEINRHYVWVDKDDEIKEGDYVLSKLFEIVKFGEKYTPSLYKKIIAASPELNLKGVPIPTEAQCYQSSQEELKKSDLKHYDELSTKCQHWSSGVPRAIEFYYDYQMMSLWHKIKLAFKSKKKS